MKRLDINEKNYVWFPYTCTTDGREETDSAIFLQTDWKDNGLSNAQCLQTHPFAQVVYNQIVPHEFLEYVEKNTKYVPILWNMLLDLRRRCILSSTAVDKALKLQVGTIATHRVLSADEKDRESAIVFQSKTNSWGGIDAKLFDRPEAKLAIHALLDDDFKTHREGEMEINEKIIELISTTSGASGSDENKVQPEYDEKKLGKMLSKPLFYQRDIRTMAKFSHIWIKSNGYHLKRPNTGSKAHLIEYLDEFPDKNEYGKVTGNNGERLKNITWEAIVGSYGRPGGVKEPEKVQKAKKSKTGGTKRTIQEVPAEHNYERPDAKEIDVTNGTILLDQPLVETIVKQLVPQGDYDNIPDIRKIDYLGHLLYRCFRGDKVIGSKGLQPHEWVSYFVKRGVNTELFYKTLKKFIDDKDKKYKEALEQEGKLNKELLAQEKKITNNGDKITYEYGNFVKYKIKKLWRDDKSQKIFQNVDDIGEKHMFWHTLPLFNDVDMENETFENLFNEGERERIHAYFETTRHQTNKFELEWFDQKDNDDTLDKKIRNSYPAHCLYAVLTPKELWDRTDPENKMKWTLVLALYRRVSLGNIEQDKALNLGVPFIGMAPKTYFSYISNQTQGVEYDMMEGTSKLVPRQYTDSQWLQKANEIFRTRKCPIILKQMCRESDHITEERDLNNYLPTDPIQFFIERKKEWTIEKQNVVLIKNNDIEMYINSTKYGRVNVRNNTAREDDSSTDWGTSDDDASSSESE